MAVADLPRALLVHGWNDDPTTGWFAWLRSELETAGYIVDAPHFEQTGSHRVERWMQQLAVAGRGLTPDSIVIAHSLGCWLSLRLLSELPADLQIAAAYFVAGFYDAPRPDAKAFFDPEPNWPVIIDRVRRRVCIYSDDDHIVTPDRTRRLAHQLQAELVCVPGHGHFLGSRGMDQFPELLQLITG